MINRKELKKLFKEKGVQSLEDFNGFLKEITKEALEVMLEGEMDEHLGYEKYDILNKDTVNSRNGHNEKVVNSKFGGLNLKTPRDRQGEFEPKVVKKRQKELTGIEDKVISLYSKGMTTRDIQNYLMEMYCYELSAESISFITDKIIDKATEWQNRPLAEVYALVFLDAIFYKVKLDGKVSNLAVYGMVGIDLEGKKDCLGLWIVGTESSKFWVYVLTELKNRGVKDVLIFAIDGLKGFPEAIQAVYPNSEIQKCIVHQIRTSLKFVSYKDRKAVVKDLKLIYNAATEDLALLELDNFSKIWDKKYPYISKSWRQNWAELSTYFKYPPEIKRLIYTTNPIESFHRGLRKVTKTRGIFPTTDSLFKLLYLATMDISKKWSMPIKNWHLIYAQLSVRFTDRIVYE